MTFWSKRRFLFRLLVAAIVVLALHVLAAYTTVETQVVLLPPPVGPGSAIVEHDRHSEEDVEATLASADDESEDVDSESGDEPWVDDARLDMSQDKQEQAVQSVMASDPEHSGTLLEALEDVQELEDKIARYVQAILDPTDSTVDRLTCPAIDHARYAHLQVPAATATAQEDAARAYRYYFALDLRQVIDLLPRLLGSVVEAARFLSGPGGGGGGGVAIAVVEGNSNDGTALVLAALAPALEAAGVRYFLRSGASLDPAGSGDRIGDLARLRSLALEPLRNSRNETARALGLPGADVEWADDAVVVFLNDVAACTEDILELLHQRVIQEADMTCAMDWHHPGGEDHPPLFYDVWISRALSGDLFFDIPTDGSWDKAEALFPFDPDARARFDHGQPFQVFACWNGATAFPAAPLLPPPPPASSASAPAPAPFVDFRSPRPGECFQGEPQLFCKDLWAAGRGRIAVVPSVNLEYTDERGRWIKASRGYVSEFVARERANETTMTTITTATTTNAHDVDDGDDDAAAWADGGGVTAVVAVPERIEWRGPPSRVKCMPSWDRQDWLPWNESLV